jgi:2,3-bisphosphoglycerate-independent phosphoglycerate mutase
VGCRPDGQREVGHEPGAGRVVPQDLVRISASIRSGEFFRLEPLVELCNRLRERGGALHLLGLLGAGGVHAIDTHLLAAVEAAVRLGVRIASTASSTGATRRRVGADVVRRLR